MLSYLNSITMAVKESITVSSKQKQNNPPQPITTKEPPYPDHSKLVPPDAVWRSIYGCISEGRGSVGVD